MYQELFIRLANEADIVFCVKKILLTKFGYRMASFYALPSNGSYGSRELLLALGKLIVDNKLDEALDKIISKSVLISEFGPELDGKKSPNINECSKVVENEDDFLKMLVFKAGKIRNMLRVVDRLSEIRQKETAKIHEETSSILCISHLSALELLVLSNKKMYYAGYQKQLQCMCGILDAYFLWLKRKKQFIKWINTVIDLKRNECTTNEILDINMEKQNIKIFFNQLEEERTSNISENSGIYGILPIYNTDLTENAIRTIVESMAAPLLNNNFKILQKNK